jgi:hypothetical protein
MGGWRGVLTALPALTAAAEAPGLAFDGSTLFVGGLEVSDGNTPAVNMYGLNPPFAESFAKLGRPTVSKLKLTGLSKGRPKLSFKLAPGTNAAPIAAVTLTLPRSLSFTRNKGKLKAGLTLCRTDGGTCRATGRDRLAITIPAPSDYLPRLTIALNWPTILRSSRKTRGRPRFALRVTDATGVRTNLRFSAG